MCLFLELQNAPKLSHPRGALDSPARSERLSIGCGKIVKFDLLIINEWLLFSISEEDSEILLSIIDRRRNYKATIVASQYDPAEWLDQIPTAVVAEAITDRLASQAYMIIIRGNKSMRETIHK
jgi:DNA replication protein DnaC